MEAVKLCNALYELLIEIQRAKNLVDDGKEVLCSNRLQGSFTKCRNLYITVKEEIESATNIVAEPNIEDKP
jgi:hypothetical protein